MNRKQLLKYVNNNNEEKYVNNNNEEKYTNNSKNLSNLIDFIKEVPEKKKSIPRIPIVNNIYSSLYYLYKGQISEKMHIADLVVSEIPKFLIKGAYFKVRYSKNVERFLLTQEEIRGLSDYLNNVFSKMMCLYTNTPLENKNYNYGPYNIDGIIWNSIDCNVTKKKYGTGFSMESLKENVVLVQNNIKKYLRDLYTISIKLSTDDKYKDEVLKIYNCLSNFNDDKIFINKIFHIHIKY
jgi:hypothetical protein